MAHASCETCGNEYDKAFQIVKDGRTHTFDSFECAIAKLAPRCSHCGLAIIGHGVEQDARIYCCANCAKKQGAHEVKDRA